MATTKADLEADLSVHDAQALSMILSAAGVGARGASTREDLAHRIADAIWWNATTPIGYVADRTTLEDITGKVAKKLGVPQAPGSAYEQLHGMTLQLVDTLPDQPGVRLQDLDEATQKRTSPEWVLAMGLGSGAGGSLVTRWGAGKVLQLLDTPLGRLLPLVPPLAPYVGAIRKGAGAVHLVTGPLGVALAVLTVNQSLGASYKKLVPLLLGVGALGPRTVEEAEIVPQSSDDAGLPEEVETVEE